MGTAWGWAPGLGAEARLGVGLGDPQVIHRARRKASSCLESWCCLNQNACAFFHFVFLFSLVPQENDEDSGVKQNTAGVKQKAAGAILPKH